MDSDARRFKHWPPYEADKLRKVQWTGIAGATAGHGPRKEEWLVKIRRIIKRETDNGL